MDGFHKPCAFRDFRLLLVPVEAVGAGIPSPSGADVTNGDYISELLLRLWKYPEGLWRQVPDVNRHRIVAPRLESDSNALTKKLSHRNHDALQLVHR